MLSTTLFKLPIILGTYKLDPCTKSKEIDSQMTQITQIFKNLIHLKSVTSVEKKLFRLVRFRIMDRFFYSFFLSCFMSSFSIFKISGNTIFLPCLVIAKTILVFCINSCSNAPSNLTGIFAIGSRYSLSIYLGVTGQTFRIKKAFSYPKTSPKMIVSHFPYLSIFVRNTLLYFSTFDEKGTIQEI